MHRHKEGRPWLIAAVGMAFFALTVLCSTAGMAYAYRGKYYPGVQVAGIQLGGLTKSEGGTLIASRVQTYLAHPLKVVLPDVTKPVADTPGSYEDLTISTTAGHLGLAYDSAKAADTAWSVGHSYRPDTWFRSVIPVLFAGHTTSIAYTTNTKSIQDFINAEVVPKIGTPTPAKLAISGDQVTILAGAPGFQVDQAVLRQEVASSLTVASDKDTTYLKATVTTVDSPITKQTLQPLADQLNLLANTKVSLAVADLSLTPNRAQLLQWFVAVQDDKGAITLNVQRDAVAKYLAAQKTLDQTKSLDAVMAKLTPLTAPTAKPVATLAVALIAKPVKAPVPDNYTPDKFPGKYVEVSLAQQKMYLVIGNQLVKSYVVSSGKWSTPTPVGTYSIHSKSPRAYSARFGLYMPYWQNFLDGEYGLHELPEWPSGYKEGQNHLGTPVSHGCVRLGVGDAKEVYDWTEIGTPVYIH
ncbi:MAG: L,D-transpeptidase family protein [bacterium]